MPLARAASTALVLFAASEAGAQDGPLSAIDWLSQSVVPGEADLGSSDVTAPGGRQGEGAVAGSMPPQVLTEPLAPLAAETPGLVAAADLGLPEDLWRGSSAGDVALRIAAVPPDLPRPAQDLLRRLMIARQASPAGGDADQTLLIARVDRLLAMGALEEARLLLGTRPPETSQAFRRYFDIALLTGDETNACRLLIDRPDISPTYPARIFCLARQGQWSVAALTLGTAESLGILTAEEDAILSHFLDPELFPDLPPPPVRPTPLLFRLYGATGERLPTSGLPLAFAHADLGPEVGWKTRLAASERLAQAGVLSARALFDTYRERSAAASGGVWMRVRAVAKLDAELAGGSVTADSLASTFRILESAGLGGVFAETYGFALANVTPDLSTRFDLFRMWLQRGSRMVPADFVDSADTSQRYALAVAQGRPWMVPATTALEAAIGRAFQDADQEGQLSAMMDDGRLGEAILLALVWIGEAARGDTDRLAEALSLLRVMGLEDTARRTAIELLLKDLAP